MKQNEFIRRYEPLWDTFEEAMGTRADTNLEDLPASYRTVCHHLSLAKLRNYSPALQQRLNHLALKGHQHLYAGKNDSAMDISRMFTRDFPRCVRTHKYYVLVATVLLLGPLIWVLLTSIQNPDFVYLIISADKAEEYKAMYAESHQDNNRNAIDDLQMFGHYVANNVGIALRTFASGLVLGLGAIAILLFNGVAIGAASGLIVSSGYGDTFWSFVIGHGSFELTAIVLAGATGMKLGFAILLPGRLMRGQALKQAAKDVSPMIYGFVVMLLIAAAIEAFWSPSRLSNSTKFVVGTVLWVVVFAYFVFAGRGNQDTAQT